MLYYKRKEVNMEKNTQEDMQTSFVGLLKAYQAMAYDEGVKEGITTVVEQLKHITRREDGTRVNSHAQILLLVLAIIRGQDGD